MIEVLVRLLADMGPATTWLAKTIAAIIAALVLYVGVAMVATLFSSDPRQRRIRYQVFRDLLDLFRRRSR